MNFKHPHTGHERYYTQLKVDTKFLDDNLDAMLDFTKGTKEAHIIWTTCHHLHIKS